MIDRFYLLLAAGFAFVVAIGLVGIQTVRLANAKTELAQYRAQVSAERAIQAATAASASEAYRATEAMRLTAQREADHESDRFAERARADRATADRMRGQLLQQAAATAARCRAAAGNPADVGQGTPAPSPGDLLADVLGRIDEAAGVAGAFADAAHGAGAACERERDALTTPTPCSTVHIAALTRAMERADVD